MNSNGQNIGICDSFVRWINLVFDGSHVIWHAEVVNIFLVFQLILQPVVSLLDFSTGWIGDASSLVGDGAIRAFAMDRGIG